MLEELRLLDAEDTADQADLAALLGRLRAEAKAARASFDARRELRRRRRAMVVWRARHYDPDYAYPVPRWARTDGGRGDG